MLTRGTGADVTAPQYENSTQFQYADGLNQDAPKDGAPGPRLTGMDRGVAVA